MKNFNFYQEEEIFFYRNQMHAKTFSLIRWKNDELANSISTSI